MFALCSAMAFAFSGSGTEADPYLIKTADDLYDVRNSPSSYFKLANDIDLKEWIADNYPEAGWVPICSSSNPFKGCLDGNGFTISGLFIKRTTDYNGLFGYADGATVKNLNVNCDITGPSYTAAIMAYGSSITMTDCTVKGNINGGQYTGALVGYGSKLTLTDCAVEGNLSGGDQTGGLVGKIEQTSNSSVVVTTKINACYVKGDISSTGKNVGGLIGYDDSSYTYYYSSKYPTYSNTSNINDCYYDGNIIATGMHVGGICGWGTGEYRRCYAKGTVSGSEFVGGIVGYLDGSSAKTDYYYSIYTYACIYSCVSLCTKIKSYNSYVNRICCILLEDTDLSPFNTNTENRAISDCQIYIGDKLQTIEDSPEQGYTIAGTALKRAKTYTAIEWDFTNTWNIDEGNGYPYLRFRQPSGGSANVEAEKASFNFTTPSALIPSVTPSDEEDTGVNITDKAFRSGDISVAFSLGTRTQTFAARLWTNEDLSNSLRVYKDGTMTIATTDNNLITRISFGGDDVSSMAASAGSINGGTWTGEAQSVTFTIGATCNKINTIEVTYKHDVLALTDVAPAILAGTYEPGKVKYERVASGSYASFCLPFDVDLSAAEGIETVYMPMEQILYNTQTQYLMMFLKEQNMASTVTAGTPFLAKIADANVSFSNAKRVAYGEPLSVNPAAKALTVFDFDGKSGVLYENNSLNVLWGGTYVATEATTGLNSFNINGSFGQHTGTLSPYRAYVMQTVKSGAASNVRGIQLNLGDDEGEVTSVFQLLNNPAATESIYDMQGRRVFNAQQGGLYIINGNKVRL